MVTDPTSLEFALLAIRQSPVMAALANKLLCVVALIFPVPRYRKATSNNRKSQMQVAHDIEEWIRFLNFIFLGHRDLVCWGVGNLSACKKAILVPLNTLTRPPSLRTRVTELSTTSASTILVSTVTYCSAVLREPTACDNILRVVRPSFYILGIAAISFRQPRPSTSAPLDLRDTAPYASDSYKWYMFLPRSLDMSQHRPSHFPA